MSGSVLGFGDTAMSKIDRVLVSVALMLWGLGGADDEEVDRYTCHRVVKSSRGRDERKVRVVLSDQPWAKSGSL